MREVSNGEVKIDEPMRWNVPRPDFIKEQEWQAHDGHIMVVLASDHDSIVAGLKAQLEHSETKVGWLLRDNEKKVRDHERIVAGKDVAYNNLDDVNMALNEKIAKQAKVIEILKACILKEDTRCGIWHDGRKAIEQAETAEIERGEA